MVLGAVEDKVVTMRINFNGEMDGYASFSKDMQVFPLHHEPVSIKVTAVFS